MLRNDVMNGSSDEEIYKCSNGFGFLIRDVIKTFIRCTTFIECYQFEVSR
jgi:hypothetical protein